MRSFDQAIRGRWPSTVTAALISIATAFVLATVLAGCGEDRDTKKDASVATNGAGKRCFVDTHMHINGIYRSASGPKTDYEAAAESALATMDEVGVQKGLIMPPPISADPQQRGKYDFRDLLEVVKQHPKRFDLLGGGGTLNPIIQKTADSEQVTSKTRREFENEADEILDAGAVGFGEMTALHISFRREHPYEEAPPDHPLFLLLADIAARGDVPIDLHMEAVSSDIPLPEGLESPPNPEVLEENIDAFERLLSHNRKARIVWAHAGWDTTGHRTVELMRRLLKDNPNLYMSMKIVGRGHPQNRPDEEGTIRPEWERLIREFPDRFVIGSDQFYGVPGSRPIGPPSTELTWDILEELPSDLARKVGCDNPRSIYRLK